MITTTWLSQAARQAGAGAEHKSEELGAFTQIGIPNTCSAAVVKQSSAEAAVRKIRPTREP
jgi:hypothetical protein